MSQIIFVKKILADGSLCKKCQEVSDRLETDKLLDTIDRIVIADERDASSEGMRLAKQHQVGRAPFFLIENTPDDVLVFDVYFKFRKHMNELGHGAQKRSAL